MTNHALFRQEVLAHQRNSEYGVVFINAPVSYTVLTLGISGIVMALGLWLAWGEWTESYVVTGYLTSSHGIARVYPKKMGVIAKQFVHSGDHVIKGAPLFILDTSYDGAGLSGPSEELLGLEAQQQSIAAEISHKHRHLMQLKPLLDKKYISVTTYHQQQDALRHLVQEKLSVTREMMRVNQEASYTVRSPIDGVVSSVIYEEGQYINLSKPMVKILPKNSDLMAELYVPVHQSGFLQRNSRVMIQYDAYPYTRFGSYHAIIEDISQTVLTDDEDDKPVPIGQPYYKVSARLATPYVMIYGQEKKVQHGMTLSAVIVGSKRKIWQWILDPLYSVYGRVFL